MAPRFARSEFRVNDGESTGGAGRPDRSGERAPGRRRVRRITRHESEPAVDEVAAGAELPVPRGPGRGRPARRGRATGAQEAPPVPGPRPAEPVVPAQRTRR